jgi:hypothetical protein
MRKYRHLRLNFSKRYAVRKRLNKPTRTTRPLAKPARGPLARYSTPLLVKWPLLGKDAPLAFLRAPGPIHVLTDNHPQPIDRLHRVAIVGIPVKPTNVVRGH